VRFAELCLFNRPTASRLTPGIFRLPGVDQADGFLKSFGFSDFILQERTSGRACADGCAMGNSKSKRSDSGDEAGLPPRIKAAFDFLDHVRDVTSQWDVSVPPRTLSPLEKNVQTAALRALQQYLLGEMDFAESPAKQARDEDEDGTASAPSPCEG